jgi:hypothetical protein
MSARMPTVKDQIVTVEPVKNKWEPLMRRLIKEIKFGGDLVEKPCPLYCGGLPRCRRSDYIRCSACGVNWVEGEDLSRHPKIERFNIMYALQPKATKPKL